MSEKMKAAALSAATKGLSRVQAERAAANASRNVNAYGQKEEGPSRWQEKKELKTQMYLKSTEKQATLNEKRCQKCRKSGHWTYECQKQAVPPENPKLDIRALMSQDGVDMKKEEKAERGSKKEKHSKRKNKKRKHRSRSSSESSESESDREDGGSRRKKKKHSRRSNRGR